MYRKRRGIHNLIWHLWNLSIRTTSGLVNQGQIISFIVHLLWHAYLMLGPAMHSLAVFAHQPGAATFSESTGQPGQSKLHQVVPAGLRPPNRTTRTYVGGSTAAEQYGSDARRARGHSAVQLGPEHHDPGPVPNLGRGTDVQLAHTAAAGGGGDARTRITDVSRT
jgi:hypothetical protein